MNLQPLFSRATILRVILLGLVCLSALSLICYTAFAQAHRAGTKYVNRDQSRSSSTGQTSDLAAREKDLDLVGMRQQWLDRFYGKVAPGAYEKALAAARALPVSPLVQSWTFQPLSPLYNDWGHLNDPCPVPSPTPNSWCGASARIDAIAVDPMALNGQVVYVGSEGGLSKSIDGGANWSYLSDNLPSQSIRSIAIDPVTPSIIYAGTGTNERFGVGIYRSVNSGGSWTINLGVPQFSGKTVGKIAIDPATAGNARTATLYASVTGSGNHSVWKSTNSGTNWTQIRGPTPAGTGNFYDIAIDPGDSRRSPALYVTAPDGLFKSTNGGTTWSASIHPRNPVPEPDKPACLSFVSGRAILFLAFTENGHVTVARQYVGISSSWTELTPTDGNLFCFGVDPVFPSRIFVGGGWDLRYSLDSGVTWVNSHDVHVDMHSIAFCPTNTQRNYLGTDGGIYRADYGGSGEMLWYSKNENLAGSLIYGLSISSDGHIIQGNQDNGTQLGWSGRNPPWGFVIGGDGYKPQIDQNNSSNYYYVYYTGDEHETCGPPPPGLRIGPNSTAPGRVLNGIPANKTPTQAYCEASSFFPAMFVAPSNWNRVIMGFKNIWRSVDAGDNWTRIGGGPNGFDSGTATVISEAAGNTDYIYAVFDDSRFWMTANAGSTNPPPTWTQRTGLPGGIRAVTVDPTAAGPKTVYVACNSANSGLYKSTDAGLHWTSLGFAALGCWDVAIDPNNSSHIFVATGAGVYLSTDGGVHWAATAGIPAGMAVSSLSLNNTARQLAASTYGRGVYILNLGPASPQSR